MNLVRDEVFAVGGAGRIAACRGRAGTTRGDERGTRKPGLHSVGASVGAV